MNTSKLYVDFNTDRTGLTLNTARKETENEVQLAP